MEGELHPARDPVTTNLSSSPELRSGVRLYSMLPLVGAGSHTQDSGILTGQSLLSGCQLERYH